MGLDEELEELEDGAETEAEQIDEEADLEEVEDFEDDLLGPDAEEADLEDAYDDFEDSDEDDDNLADDEEFEEVELEFNEDDIVSYLVDEDDNEIGFTLLDEDGNEVEYYYADEDDVADGDDDNPFDFITKEKVAETTHDMNAIYKDGIAVASELKGAFDDIKGALDFKNMLGMKK